MLSFNLTKRMSLTAKEPTSDLDKGEKSIFFRPRIQIVLH